MFLSLDSSQERQENSNSKAPSPSVDQIGGNSSCALQMFHDAIHSRGREKMMKRKGMSCHTLPTSMISGVICYWSPPGLLNLLSEVNLVFLVDLPFPAYICSSFFLASEGDLIPAGLEYNCSWVYNAHKVKISYLQVWNMIFLIYAMRTDWIHKMGWE